MKSGFASAAAAALAVVCLLAGCGTAPAGGEGEPAAIAVGAPAPAAVESRPDDGELAPLRARVAALEGELAAARAAPASGDAGLPDSASLARALEALDGAALTRDVERLILAGDPGCAVLLGFLDGLEGQAAQLAALTQQPQMAYALLRVVARQPDAAAGGARSLLRAVSERPRPAIRRLLYAGLPVFLRLHDGRYPELRRELEQDVVAHIEHPGEDVYRALVIARELGCRPSIDALQRLLEDPAARPSHPLAIQLLGARGDDGLEALARYVRGPTPSSRPSLMAALQEIAALEEQHDKGILASLRTAPDPQLRWLAGVAHFSRQRDLSSYPIALELLNADHDPRLKHTFLLRLRRQNQAILDQLVARLDSLEQSEVKEMVKQVAASEGPPAPAPAGPLLPPRAPLPPAGRRGEEKKS